MMIRTVSPSSRATDIILQMRLAFWFAAWAPIVLVVLAFVAFLRLEPTSRLEGGHLPSEPYDSVRCNWFCHNHGCRHAPLLPSYLTADNGLFGKTIGLLHRAGRQISPTAGVGYRAVNVGLFCGAWPAAMYGLYLVALHQRMRLGGRRA